ncbi:MAG: DUF58 domain-containing protein [Thiohalomonas sp.]|nr:DUF58 domain-containing protein [Thiohalomonas sp.]
MSIWKNKTSKQTDNSHTSSKQSRATQVDLQGLIQLRYQSTHLSLGSQRKAYSSLSGNYTSPFKGRGLNFDEVRPYQLGDDIRNIDWNVTARTDKVHTKVFKEERERPVFIIVDLRRSLYFGTRHCLKSVTAAKAAALFAWAGADNRNRIGGLIFNDTDHIEMRAKGGHQGVLQFLKMLTDFHNKSISKLADEALNSELLFARIQKVIHPGSIVLMASDFHQFNDAFLKHIRHIARHNDLLMAHIYDSLERRLPPPGQYGISNGIESQSLDTGNQLLRSSFEELFQKKSDYIAQSCLQNQIHLINLATHDKVADQFLAALGKDAGVRRIARSRH